MGQGVAPSIPRADFSTGGSGSGADLPFAIDDRMGGDEVLVHFKVCSKDPTMTMKVTRIIEAQLLGQRVGNRAIKPVITDESVEMTAATMQVIAAQVTPLVAAALGVTGIGV